MRVRIDAERCIGSGNCENAAAAVFRLGDDGLAHVLRTEPGSGLERRIRGAALGCPTGAILVEDS